MRGLWSPSEGLQGSGGAWDTSERGWERVPVPQAEEGARGSRCWMFPVTFPCRGHDPAGLSPAAPAGMRV